jgi:hypothetical protein
MFNSISNNYKNLSTINKKASPRCLSHRWEFSHRPQQARKACPNLLVPTASDIPRVRSIINTWKIIKGVRNTSPSIYIYSSMSINILAEIFTSYTTMGLRKRRGNIAPPYLFLASCSQQNINLGEDAVFQCVMIMSTAIPNILGVNILLKVAYP